MESINRAKVFEAVLSVIVVCLLMFWDAAYVKTIVCFALIGVFVSPLSKLKTISIFKWENGFFSVISRSVVYALVIVGISYYVLIPILELVMKSSVEYGAFEQIKGNLPALMISLAIGGIIGGLMEEVIFRGFLLQVFERLIPEKVGIVIGVILTTVLFGYLHSYQGISGQIITGATGLALALLYLYNNKDIWTNVFTHLFVNTLSLLLIYFGLY